MRESWIPRFVITNLSEECFKKVKKKVPPWKLMLVMALQKKKKKVGGRSYVSSNQHNLKRCSELK